jgi:hypothetical protein
VLLITAARTLLYRAVTLHSLEKLWFCAALVLQVPCQYVLLISKTTPQQESS